MKQFCRPIEVYQGVMANPIEKPMVFRMIMSATIESPAIPGKQSTAYATEIDPATASPKTSIPRPKANPIQWMPLKAPAP